MKMSKSKLNCFLQCPRRFFYDYLDDSMKRSEPEPDSPLQIGIDVHEIFEWYHLQADARNIKPPYRDSIRSILMRHPLSEKYSEFIENFINFNLELIASRGVPDYLPLAVEEELYDAELDFHGIIDVVLEGEDGVILLDYKTGKKARPISEYLLELTFYKILYEKVKKRKVEYCGIYFPKPHKYRMVRALGPDESCEGKGPCIGIDDEIYLLSMIDNVRTIVAESDNVIARYRKEPTFLCNYCDYADLCNDEGFLEV